MAQLRTNKAVPGTTLLRASIDVEGAITVSLKRRQCVYRIGASYYEPIFPSKPKGPPYSVIYPAHLPAFPAAGNHTRIRMYTNFTSSL